MKNNKITIIVGHATPRPDNWDSMTVNERYAAGWRNESFHVSGFWKKETILKLAAKRGFVGDISVSYVVMDYSGKGRTSTVDRIVITV